MVESRMVSKKSVVQHFGSVAAVAQFFGITDKAVYKWGEDDDPIPRERELELMLRLPADFGAPLPDRSKAVA